MHRCNSYSSQEFRVLQVSLRPALRWKCAGRQHAGPRPGLFTDCSSRQCAVSAEGFCATLLDKVRNSGERRDLSALWIFPSLLRRERYNPLTRAHLPIRLTQLTPKQSDPFWIDIDYAYIYYKTSKFRRLDVEKKSKSTSAQKAIGHI